MTWPMIVIPVLTIIMNKVRHRSLAMNASTTVWNARMTMPVKPAKTVISLTTTMNALLAFMAARNAKTGLPVMFVKMVIMTMVAIP